MMICGLTGKNSPFFGTNKSESFIRRKRMKLERHKNTNPQSFISVTELLQLRIDWSQEPNQDEYIVHLSDTLIPTQV